MILFVQQNWKKRPSSKFILVIGHRSNVFFSFSIYPTIKLHWRFKLKPRKVDLHCNLSNLSFIYCSIKQQLSPPSHFSVSLFICMCHFSALPISFSPFPSLFLFLSPSLFLSCPTGAVFRYNACLRTAVWTLWAHLCIVWREGGRKTEARSFRPVAPTSLEEHQRYRDHVCERACVYMLS